MPRIKISLPEKSIYNTEIDVRITDINYGNHLGNDSLVGILHEARLKWLTSLGYSELNVEETGLIMSELVVNFLSESFFGDKLIISIFIGEITASGFELFYLLETNRENKQIIIAKAKTGMVCYDYASKKISSVPEKFKKLFS
jgi:acyl-CoA thioesterase FadM